MIFGVFLIVCLAAAANLQRLAPLPNPMVDVTSITKDQSPWSGLCCVLSKLIHHHFYFKQVLHTTDLISYDVDYFCEHLVYTITQMLHIQKSVDDCKVVSELVTRLVAGKMLETRSHTIISVFNNVVLASFRSYSASLLDGSQSRSVISIISRALANTGLDARDRDYIKRRVAYDLNSVYTARVVRFLERLELSHTLTHLASLQQRVMTIINGTHFDTDAAMTHIRAVVKETLRKDVAHSCSLYKLRAYYIVFFKATIASAQANKVVTDIQFVLSNTRSGAISHGQIATILSAVTNALGGQQRWMQGMLHGITGRSLSTMQRTITSSGSHTGVFISSGQLSTLINKLGWINLRIIPQPKNLLAEYKELLGELAKYKSLTERFASSLRNRPLSERHYHASSLSFIQKIIYSIGAELKDNRWVHTYNTK